MVKEYKDYIDTPEAIWFSRIPNTWNCTKMRELFSERTTKVSDKEFQPLSVGKMGIVPQLETAVKTDNGDNRKLICEGDFAINSRSDRKGSSGISEYTGSASLIITVLKPYESLNRKYYHYLLRSNGFVEEFYRNGKGLVSDLWTTKWQEMKNIFIPVPPKEDQNQIACYLDWKTAEIDRFVHQKKKQIKRLEEYKFTKIDELITKGTNMDVPMKESGVEWIGAIPEHWDVHTIKQHFKVRKRIAGKEGYDVLSITQQGLKVKDIASNEGQMAMDYSGYQFVYPGDFAMNHMDLITGYVDLSDKFGVTSPDYRVFTLEDTKNCYPEFYLRVFQVAYKRRIFYKFGKGAANQGRWRLPQRAFYNFSIQIPPVEEQKMIEEECKNIEANVDEMIVSLKNEIELLQELRTKIIADVVTGQIDVRDVVIPDTSYEEDIDTDEIEDDAEEIEESEE